MTTTITRPRRTRPDSILLVTGDDCSLTVRSHLFGEMLTRATPIVEHYVSDLYHDALFIDQHVTKAVCLDFLVREHGTHISLATTPLDHNTARLAASSAGPAASFWRITVRQDRRGWWADFVKVPLDQVRALPVLR